MRKRIGLMIVALLLTLPAMGVERIVQEYVRDNYGAAECGSIVLASDGRITPLMLQNSPLIPMQPETNTLYRCNPLTEPCCSDQECGEETDEMCEVAGHCGADEGTATRTTHADGSVTCSNDCECNGAVAFVVCNAPVICPGDTPSPQTSCGSNCLPFYASKECFNECHQCFADCLSQDVADGLIELEVYFNLLGQSEVLCDLHCDNAPDPPPTCEANGCPVPPDDECCQYCGTCAE